MFVLPTDVWWKIFGCLWAKQNPQQYSPDNPLLSFQIHKMISHRVSEGITSNLFLLRRICRLWKHVIDKHSCRYYSTFTKNYYITLDSTPH